MLFNSGAPSLVSFTRLLSGDDATTGLNLFSDAAVKEVVNEEYLALQESLRDKNVGYGLKRTYATTVANQVYYEKPDDFIRLETAELEIDGGDLSALSVAASSAVFLVLSESEDALRGYELGNTTSPERIFHQDTHLGIVAPPATGGSNALRLTYQASAVELVDDTDEPLLPRPYHQLICYEAAATLRGTRDLSIDPVLAQKWANLRRRFEAALKSPVTDRQAKVSVAGMPNTRSNYFTRAGFVTKR